MLTVISLMGDPWHVGHVGVLSGYIPSLLVAGISSVEYTAYLPNAQACSLMHLPLNSKGWRRPRLHFLKTCDSIARIRLVYGMVC
jgi:hypothetical protein